MYEFAVFAMVVREGDMEGLMSSRLWICTPASILCSPFSRSRLSITRALVLHFLRVSPLWWMRLQPTEKTPPPNVCKLQLKLIENLGCCGCIEWKLFLGEKVWTWYHVLIHHTLAHANHSDWNMKEENLVLEGATLPMSSFEWTSHHRYLGKRR